MIQQQLDADGINAQIFGINEVGYEGSNETITTDRDLPWLQDVDDQDVWNTWSVTYRDIYILDEENRLVDVFNATEQDLNQPINYDDFVARLQAAAP